MRKVSESGTTGWVFCRIEMETLKAEEWVWRKAKVCGGCKRLQKNRQMRLTVSWADWQTMHSCR